MDWQTLPLHTALLWHAGSWSWGPSFLPSHPDKWDAGRFGAHIAAGWGSFQLGGSVQTPSESVAFINLFFDSGSLYTALTTAADSPWAAASAPVRS